MGIIKSALKPEFKTINKVKKLYKLDKKKHFFLLTKFSYYSKNVFFAFNRSIFNILILCN